MSRQARTATEWSKATDPSFTATDSVDFGRGVSFFDAIYGFAITLLIANVDAPPPEAWRSLQALGDSGVPSQLTGFVLSFVVIAVYWRINVKLTRELSGMDGPTIIVNLVAAGLVVLVPFTTQGISDPDSGQLPLPVAMYAINIALVSLAQIAVFQVGRRRGLEIEPRSPYENRLILIDALISPFVFLLSVPIALTYSADAAKWTWATLLILGPVSGILTTRLVVRHRVSALARKARAAAARRSADEPRREGS